MYFEEHSGSGGLAQSSFEAGRLPQEDVEEVVTSEENLMRIISVWGMRQETVSGAWMHSISVFSSSQAIMGNDVFKNKVVPGLVAPGHSTQTVPTGRGKVQNMQAHERYR